MDGRIPQYQRAVTPTIESGLIGSSGTVRGKVLSYNSSLNRGGSKINGVTPVSIGAAMDSRNRGSTQSSTSPRSSSVGLHGHQDINVQGRSSSNRGLLSGNSNAGWQPDPSGSSVSVVNRGDLIPLSDELPHDGIIFARIRNVPDSMVVIRTPEERLRNPERLNLDRRQLDACPILEQEQRLRLLNYQNNSIRSIRNLESLPNLIFLDLYNNKISSLEGPLSAVKGLRVLMAGKNKISAISNLHNLRKLDVLDLHSNEIRKIEGLDGLSDLRVLNLAGNRISHVSNLTSLASLTELNLRRNQIDTISGLDKLPALQRVFLSHNQIAALESIRCVLNIQYLIELSLDGNPISDSDPAQYRKLLILNMPGLRHLDLRRVTEEERNNALLADDPSAEKLSSIAKLRLSTGELSEKQMSPQDHLNSWGVSFARQTVSASRSGGDEADVDLIPGIAVSAEADDTAGAESDIFLREGGAQRKEIDNGSAGEAIIERDENSVEVKANVKQSFTELARTGNLPIDDEIFDLESIKQDEKSLVVVGAKWEWTCSKRLLQGVSEITLCNISEENIIHKFGSGFSSSFPNLKTLRLSHNGFKSLKSVDFIPRMWGNVVEHLHITNNPLCSTSSFEMLRVFLIASMPKLISFNGEIVNDIQRDKAEAMYGPLLNLHRCAGTNLSSGVPCASMNTSTTMMRPSTGKTQHLKAQQQHLLHLKRRTIAGSMCRSDDDGLSSSGKFYGDTGIVDFMEYSENDSFAATENRSSETDFRNRREKSNGIGSSTGTSELSKRALKQTNTSAEFNAAFEKAVKRIVKDSIDGIVCRK